MIVVTLQLKHLNAMKCSFSLDRSEVIFKYSSWKWKTTDVFHLNMSFVFFHLKYSGEACLQERVLINSTGHGNLGRYCGRRHYWSVFASHMPIVMEFYSYELSRSKFVLTYQITNKIFNTFLLRYKNQYTFDDIEHVGFVYPFSWIHKYSIACASYYIWNIVVPKMFKLFIKIFKSSQHDKIFSFLWWSWFPQ